jgi:hypothetical protein
MMIDGRIIIDIAGIDPRKLIGTIQTLISTLHGSFNGTFAFIGFIGEPCPGQLSTSANYSTTSLDVLFQLDSSSTVALCSGEAGAVWAQWWFVLTVAALGSLVVALVVLVVLCKLRVGCIAKCVPSSLYRRRMEKHIVAENRHHGVHTSGAAGTAVAASECMIPLNESCGIQRSSSESAADPSPSPPLVTSSTLPAPQPQRHLVRPVPPHVAFSPTTYL